MASIHELLDFAFRCHQQGSLAQAEQLYRQILQADPKIADAHHLLGALAYQTNRFDLAVVSYRQALALNPQSAAYYSNLGLAQKALGQAEAAADSYRQALRLGPDLPEAHSNLGQVLQELGRLDEAESHCRQALRLQPVFADAHNALANVLAAQGRLDEAEAAYRHALQINAKFAKAWNNLGNLYAKQDKLDESLRCYRQALLLAPDFAEAYYNLANAVRLQGKIDDAIGLYRQAIKLSPKYLGAHNNRANLHKERCQFDEALACYDEAMRCDPNFGETHMNRGMLLLLLGQWQEGWREYDWRWQTKEFAWYAPQRPRWDGSDLKGASILLDAEQGNGDTLQFVRYAALVKQRGGNVLVRCQPALVPLLASCKGIDQLIPNGAELPPFDFQVPLLSLPGIFRTLPETIPTTVPYLFADDKAVARWRDELGPPACQGGRCLQIGIAWKGSPTFLYDRERSIPLTSFRPLAQIEGVQLVSLQKGPGTDQLRARAGQFSVVDLESRLGDDSESFMNIAAIMMNLDLVITCDTAIAHLAGALGVPVWVGLPFSPDWRWLLQRDDTPWYPTMRLFRQPRPGAWFDVFERMAEVVRQRNQPSRSV